MFPFFTFKPQFDVKLMEGNVVFVSLQPNLSVIYNFDAVDVARNQIRNIFTPKTIMIQYPKNS